MKNQGLLRTGLTKVREDHELRAVSDWKEFNRLTDQLKKGSYLFVTDEAKEDLSLDRFLGFRSRMRKKYSWLHGYFHKHKADVEAQLQELLVLDPTEKVYHNVRPSEEKEIKHKDEREFLKKKRALETDYAETVGKISAWNSYFGPQAEEVIEEVVEKKEEEIKL